MKKRLFAALLVIAMLGCALLTSCNNSETITAEEDRRPLTITLYGIKGDGTTDEAIKAVQKEMNVITKQYFSTQLLLRLYTEKEYNDVIDNLVADIALKEEDAANAAAASDSAAKESKRVAAIDKLINADKAEVTTRSRYVKTETDEATTEETYDTEYNILNEAVEAYPTADATQVDIFLICGTANLNKYVTDEKYATDGESFLVSLDEELKFSAKSLNQYINPTVLLAGKVNNKTYAIPTNKRIADETTYLVLNKDLLKSTGTDADSIKALTSKSLINYLQAIVDSNNSDTDTSNDVVPMLSQPDAPGIVGLFEENTIFGTYVANTAVAGFKSVPKNLLSAYQYTDYYIYMQQYKRNGYLWDEVPEGTVWGSAVITGDEDTVAAYDEDHYVVKVLEKAMATSESAGSYMYGISKYTKDSSRCMEIITYLNTDSDFRNLFQYGIEGSNYKIDPDTGKLVRLNNDYMMNIEMTGNMFIAHPEEDMELDVWEKAKTANLSTIVSPYMGFLFETKDNAEVIENVKKLSEKILAELDAYDVAADLEVQVAALKLSIADYEAASGEKSLSAALAAIEEARVYIADAQAAVEAAEAELVAPKAELTAAQNLLKPYTAAVNSAKLQATVKQQEIDEQKAAIETAEKTVGETAAEGETAVVYTEADIAKMKEELAKLEAELVVLNGEVRAAEGRAYDYQKEVTAKQAEYAKYEAVVTAAEDARDAIEMTVTSTDDKGETTQTAVKAYTAFTSRTKTYESLLKAYNALVASLDSLTVPEQSEITAEYAEMEAHLAGLNAELEKLETELKRYRNAGGVEGDLYQAYTAAKAAVSAAADALNGKTASGSDEAVIGAVNALETLETENKGYDTEVMKAYIDMVEAREAVEALQEEIDKANAVITEKRAAIAALDTAAEDYQKQADALQAEITKQEANIAKYETDIAAAKTTLSEFEAAYNKSQTAEYLAVKAKIDAAKADVETAQAAYDAAVSNETYLAYIDIESKISAQSSTIKAYTSTMSKFYTRDYAYRDSIYSSLYTAYFKKLVAECEKDADYQVFMNVGEDNADNEKGVVYIYNEWYSSMYGS